MPVPLQRPDDAASTRAIRQIGRAGLTVPAPRRVSDAAGETGLPLDTTSLVGIIDASTGREALLRLPSGRFRRVTAGDVLEGWRVRDIDRESLSLSRGGQSRRLYLVNR